jgi:hypothetical protein
MRNEVVNSQILEIWERNRNKTFKEKEVRAPLFLREFNRDVEILFIGSNPSFNEDWIRKRLKEKYGVEEDSENFFVLRINSSSNIDFCKKMGSINVSDKEQYVDKCIEIEEKIASDYPYFTKFKVIAKENDLERKWEHLDLFLYREISQKKLKELVWRSPKGLTEFGEDQLKVTFGIINKTEPRVIIVVSAFASKIIQERLKPQWNDDLGYHIANIADRKIPIFFSSMLSGQRALDEGSFERLRWHIRKALRNRSP